MSKLAVFTVEDDDEILRMVGKYGPAWTEIAKRLTNRFSPNRIRGRYLNHLRPTLRVDTPWTEDDEDKLDMLVKTYGHKWTWFSDAYFGGRSPTFLKSRYEMYIRKLYEKASEKLDPKSSKENEKIMENILKENEFLLDDVDYQSYFLN